jgi:hypothetical protein
MGKTYKSAKDIPKMEKTPDGRTYYFYRTISDDADQKYRENLEKKVSKWGYSLWVPITVGRTEMWAIYTDKKQVY